MKISDSQETNKLSIESLKNHLKCHPDKDVFYNLATIYEYMGKYYLAELAYKKAGATDKITQAEKNRIDSLNGQGTNKFQELSVTESEKFSQLHLEYKAFSIISFVIGSAAFSTGAALFIHDKAGGANSLAAQYSLMLGGLSFIAGGIASSFESKRNLAISNAISKGAKTYEGDNGTTPEEYYIYSGNKNETQKNLSKMYRNHGITLTVLSVPMFAIAIYGFFDSYNYILRKNNKEKDDESWDPDFVELDILVGHLYQMFSLLPALTSLTGGIILLVKASKYEKLSTDPNLFTLDSITPIINPVSKTYGLALGFSF